MRSFYDKMALAYFALATVFLMVLALLMLGAAFWEMLKALTSGEILVMLESVGLVIIGFAIIETAKFVAEEEILRRKELRSAVESRRSLTKFITIIVIAASLEALVMIFETSRTDVTKAIYPAALFAAAMFALIALGAFQWMSSRIAPPPAGADGRFDRPQRGRAAGGVIARPMARKREGRPWNTASSATAARSSRRSASAP